MSADEAEDTMGSSEQQYSLRWHDFQTNLLATFRRLKEDEDFVDVTLACDERAFKAHKVVLSACSPYFRRLLKNNPCQHPIVILRDVKERILESLLRFMYNGDVNVSQELLEEFLKTAQMLQIKGLADVMGSDHERMSSDSVPNWSHMNSSGRSLSPSGLPPTVKRIRIERDLSPNNSPPRTGGDHGGGVERDEAEQNNIKNHNNNTPPSRRESLLGQALEGTAGVVPLSLPLNTHRNMDGNISSHNVLDDDTSDDEEEETNSREKLDLMCDLLPKLEPQDYPDDSPTPSSDVGGHYSDLHRHPFPSALLAGFQGIPGFLPGPSGLQNSQDANYMARRGLDLMRVRATDPRPCPKCGKIYRSAHTLRTHLEDKHTLCPGYRCVLCGTVAKSRNSLHSHMSRQHRGISTKDLPVLPMPSPFDPDLAAKLLAKAGVRVSPAELAARASPTGIRRSDLRLDLKLPTSTTPTSHLMASGVSITLADPGSSAPPFRLPFPASLDIQPQYFNHPHNYRNEDPEDLSLPNTRPSILHHHPHHFSSDITLTPTSHVPTSNSVPIHPDTTITPVSAPVSTPSPKVSTTHPSTSNNTIVASSNKCESTGSAILDTYLQFIAENSSNLAAMTFGNSADRKIPLPLHSDGMNNKAVMLSREEDLATSEDETDGEDAMELTDGKMT